MAVAKNNPIRDAIAQLHSLIGDEYPFDKEKSISHDHDTEHEFFTELDSCVNSLMASYGVSEDEAFDFVAEVSNLLETQGIMPLFPTEESTEADLVRWTVTARTNRFHTYVMKEAKRKYKQKDRMLGAKSARMIYKKMY